MTTAIVATSTGARRANTAIVLAAPLRRVAARAVALTPTPSTSARAVLPRSFPKTLPRILLPGGLRQDATGAVANVAPNTSVLAACLEAHNFTVAELAHAARYVVPVASFGALLAYAQGYDPIMLWGPDLARRLARALGGIAAAANLAEKIADGAWILVTDGESVGAIDAQIAAGAGLGMIPGAYVGRAEGPVSPARQILQQLSFSFGTIGMVAAVTGPLAVESEAVAAGVARTEAEAAAVVERSIDPALIATGGRLGPEAATAAARTSLGAWSRIVSVLGTRTAALVPKWAAITAIGVVGVTKIPDIVNTNREATQAATEAGIEGAGALLQLGIKLGDPRIINAALEHMRGFQAGAQDSDKWLYAAAAFAAGMYLSKK